MMTNKAITKIQMKQLDPILSRDFNLIYIEPLQEYINPDFLADDGGISILIKQLPNDCKEISKFSKVIWVA